MVEKIRILIFSKGTELKISQVRATFLDTFSMDIVYEQDIWYNCCNIMDIVPMFELVMRVYMFKVSFLS